MKYFFDNLNNNYYIKEFILKKLKILSFNDFNNSYYKNLIIKKFLFEKSESNCFLEFSPLAGGTDSVDLNIFFFNFYCRWLKKKFFNIEFYNNSIYGNKKIIYIKNNYSFSLFNQENGIHRIIRKNPLVSSEKIQTSFLKINILPKINNNLIIKNDDLIFESFKSKGSGGQHVNTTNSAIRLIHKPTKTIINCQSERSQTQNKIFALKMLEYKFYIQKNIDLKKYINTFKNKNKYVRTYNFINNEVIDHNKKIKFNLNFFFKDYINFVNLI